MEKLEVMVTFHKLLSYILFPLALFSGTVQSYVYQVDHWSNGAHDLYCLQDYHDEIPGSIKQRKDLVAAAHNGQSLIVVEDMAGYEGDHAAVTQYITSWNPQQPSQQFLLHITTKAHDKAIPVCNVEFRQPTVGGIEGAAISAKDALDCTEAIEQEVYAYQDGEPFDSYYASVLHKWESAVSKPMKQWFAPIRQSNELFYKAVQSLPFTPHIGKILMPYQVGHLSEADQKGLVCKLYNSELLDLRMVHALAQSPQYKTIYLCAGSGHINRIQSFLSKAGYTYHASYVKDAGEQSIDLADAFTALKKTDRTQVAETTPVQSLPAGVMLFLVILILLGLIIVAYTKRGVLLGLIIVLSTIAPSVGAYVTEIQFWSNGNQNITCLSDGHYPTSLSIDQTDEFIAHALKHKDSSAVIIEDILAYDGKNKEIQRALNGFVQPELHFLPELTNQCKKAGLNAHSVEFRHDQFASYAGADVSSKEIYAASQCLRDAIPTYNDGPAFARCYARYQQELQELEDQCRDFVDQFRSNDLTLNQAVSASTSCEHLDGILDHHMGRSDYSPLFKKKKILKIYDAPLLDVLILRQMAQHTDKQNIFICAGRWHIDNLASSFEELGYTKVLSAQGVNSITDQLEFPKSVDVGKAFESIEKEYRRNTKPVQTSSTSLFILLILFVLATIPLIVKYARKQWLYAFLLAGTSSQVLPYCYYTSTWKNGDQLIHLFSDEHSPHPIGKQQREYVIDRAQQSKSVVIVEDMKSYSGSNPEVIKAVATYYDWSHLFLMNMTAECHNNNIPVVNVEFRYPSNASLLGYNVSADEVLRLSDELKEVVKTYTDRPEYNRWYKEVLEELEYCQQRYEPFFKQLRGKHQTLRALLPQTKYYSSLDKVLQKSMKCVETNVAAKKDKLITMYDAALIDILIVHALAQYRDVQDVYICAGGWHISNLEDAFESFGYECMDSKVGTAMEGSDFPDALEFTPTAKKSPSNTASHDSLFGYGLLLLLVFVVLGALVAGRYTLALIILSTLSTTMHSHIFKIDKWTHEDQAHTLFTLRDFHTSRLPMNHKGNEQRNAIVQLGKERSAYVIAEDIYPDAPVLFNDPINYNPNKIGPMEDKTPFKDSTTPLLALTPACSENRVKFDNVEFKQVGYVSDMGHIITPADCVKSVARIANEIRTYTDTPALDAYYKQQLAQYDTMYTQANSFFDYLLTITDKTTKELFEEPTVPFSTGIDQALKTFGWSDQRITTTSSTDKMIALLRYYSVPLVDAKLAHALYEHRTNPNLIVCAGFKHIEAIEEILPSLGFTHTGTYGKDLLEEPLPEPSALDIKASFDVLDPHPILPTHDTNFGRLLIVALIFCLGLAWPLRRKKRA